MSCVRFRSSKGRTMLSATPATPPQTATTTIPLPQCPLNVKNSAAGTQISADPTLETDDDRDPNWRRPMAEWPPDPTLTVAADTLAPLVALFNTREAHGVRAMKLTQKRHGALYAHFRLTNTSIPMSWAISTVSASL